MINHIKEPSTLRSLPDLPRNRPAILQLVAVHPQHVDDRDLVPLDGDARLETEAQSVLQTDRPHLLGLCRCSGHLVG